jgi:hypothetical protein
MIYKVLINAPAIYEEVILSADRVRFGLSPNLMNGFQAWANHNPDLVFDGDPPPPPDGTRAAT